MTGTGTQADPYIPTTLTEWLTAAGTNGAYVAMDSDINAADDPEYTGELSSQIAFNCYSMDGRDHTIRGITVRAGSFLVKSSSGSSYIKNIYMLDMAHKKGNNNAYLMRGGNIYQYIDFNNVRLSAKISVDGGAVDIGFRINLTNCAINVEYDGVGFCGIALFNSVPTYKTTVYVQNVASTNAITVQSGGSCTVSGLVLDSPSNQIILISSTTCQYSYYAVTNSPNNIAINCGTSGTVDLVAVDGTDADVTLQSGWTQCTIAQLKDKDYLSSIGWLP